MKALSAPVLQVHIPQGFVDETCLVVSAGSGVKVPHGTVLARTWRHTVPSSVRRAKEIYFAPRHPCFPDSFTPQLPTAILKHSNKV